MSYCRINGKDSDVYFLATIAGLECCACRLAPKEDFGSFESRYFKTRSGARAHLLAHRKGGHKVPEYAIKRLTDEIRFMGNRFAA